MACSHIKPKALYMHFSSGQYRMRNTGIYKGHLVLL